MHKEPGFGEHHFHPPVLKLLVVIVDWEHAKKVTQILRKEFVRFQYVCGGEGTASSDILDMLGIGSVDKGLIFCLHPDFRIKELVGAVSDQMELSKPGKGIAFTIPLSGVSNPMTHAFSEENLMHLAEIFGTDKKEKIMELFSKQARERWKAEVEKDMDKASCENIRYDLIVSVVNQGYCDDLMEVARGAGARSGTIIHARRAGLEDTVKFFGISVQAEKEVVTLLVLRESKKAIMKAIHQFYGLNTDARGIVFSLPVDTVAGVDFS